MPLVVTSNTRPLLQPEQRPQQLLESLNKKQVSFPHLFRPKSVKLIEAYGPNHPLTGH
jgi:hypothetical protein